MEANENMKYVEQLRANPYIREHDCGKGISSFNYSAKAFWDKHWDEDTIKARGLFVDTNTGKVVCRGFQKFFNLGERHNIQWYADSMAYPVFAYQKENGYLLLVSSIDGDNLMICSKSTTDNWYAANGREMLESFLGDMVKDFADTLYQNDMTAVFECITHKNEHIVRYHEDHLVLLDFVFNNWKFYMAGYTDVCYWADYYGFQVKKKIAKIHNKEEFFDFCFEANGQIGIEGYVLCDCDLNMVKVKTGWYRYKKAIRTIVGQLHAGKTPDMIKNYHERIHNDYIEEYLPNIVHQYEIANNGECPPLSEVWAEIAPMM